jgi:hypothetical protein
MVKSRNSAGFFILDRDSSNSVDEDTKSQGEDVNKHMIHTHMYIHPH